VARRHNGLTGRILELLEKHPEQQIQEPTREFKINMTFLVSYLKALESKRKVKLKKIGQLKFISEVIT
jgi:hypothetical protein